MSLSRFLVIPLVLIAFPLGADQDRRDFDLMAEQAAPMSGSSYGLVRCAGLYRAMRLHAGRAVLGADRWDEARSIEASLARAAALSRAEEFSMTWQMAEGQTLTDVAAMARLYQAHFEQMITETGRPWTRDPLWQSDNAECGGMLDQL